MLEKESDEEPTNIRRDIAILLLSFLVKTVFSLLNKNRGTLRRICLLFGAFLTAFYASIVICGYCLIYSVLKP